MKHRFSIIQWEALALLLIGISINQMRSLPEGSTAMGLPIAMGAYIYTFIFLLSGLTLVASGQMAKYAVLHLGFLYMLGETKTNTPTRIWMKFVKSGRGGLCAEFYL